jgi:hypothetical protein
MAYINPNSALALTNKTDVANELHGATAAGTFTHGIIFFSRTIRLVTARSGTSVIATLENLCIGITQLDCNVSFHLILETNSLRKNT